MEDILSKIEACMTILDSLALPDRDVTEPSTTKGSSGGFVSLIKVDGKPILPPLMTKEKTVEMARYKAAAVRREREKAERHHQNLIKRVETIVNSFEESRHSSASKENSPEVKQANTDDSAVTDSVSKSVSLPKKKLRVPEREPCYSPLKYMVADEEDDWDVKPATPWRRPKQTKPKSKTQIAANFDRSGNHPITSTMRTDITDQVVMATISPDISAISLASSRAMSGESLPGFRESTPQNTRPAVEEIPGVSANLAGPKQGINKSTTTSQPAVIKEVVITPASLDPKVAATVKTTASVVSASAGSQSTTSSSSSVSVLNQTVIDLSQVSPIENTEKIGDSPKDEMNKKQDNVLSVEVDIKARQDAADRDYDAPTARDAIQSLSDTESYMSLLGEYSLLPTPGLHKSPDASNFANTKSSVHSEDMSHTPVNNENISNEVSVHSKEEVKKEEPAILGTDASVGGTKSVLSTDASEMFGSSLGTLGQSCTLPISLSMTSESTLHGVGESWNTASASTNVTPTDKEMEPSAHDADPKDEKIRGTPVGQESNATDEFGKQASVVPGSDKSVTLEMANGNVKAKSNETDQIKKEIDVTDNLQVRTKVDVEVSTPVRQHVRRSSYTLDFPSPALLDAEARHQAPHISETENSSKKSRTKSGSPVEDAGVKTINGDDKNIEMNPSDLSSGMEALNLDEVSEAKVLQLQLSCLEQMQQRLQRQHEEQMKELMHQQKQEQLLLEQELQELKRKAAESAMGHVEQNGDVKMSANEERANPILNGHGEDLLLDKKLPEVLEPDTKVKPSPLNNVDVTKFSLDPQKSGNEAVTSPSRKRRFDGRELSVDESATEMLVQVLPSYIRPSTTAGSGRARPYFPPPSLDDHSMNVKKLTPQDSLESDHINGPGGLIEVPPSYISPGSYHGPVTRSPTHSRSSVTPTSAVTSSHTHNSSSVTPTSMMNGSLDHGGSVATPTFMHSYSTNESFFLNDSQTGEVSEKPTEPHPVTSSYFRPWTITPSMQMDSRFDLMSAGVKGYLTRALMKTPKVQALVKTIKDTQNFLLQFQAETPVKRGLLSEQDTKLAHRVLAQLRAAQYELDDLFHSIPIHQRMAIITKAREQERENFFSKKVSPPAANDKAKPLSAATRKAIERRQQHSKDGDSTLGGPKRQKMATSDQRPKSAAYADPRILRPVRSHQSPARPASAHPRTSMLSRQSVKQSSNKPFPMRPVMVSRNNHSNKVTTASAKPSSKTRTITTKPTTKSTMKLATQTRTKGARRSLYPVTVGVTKKTQHKQADPRKP